MRARVALQALLLAALAVAAAHASAQTSARIDYLLKDVYVEEKIGQKIPADLSFTDDNGRTVRIGQYIGDKPLLISLNYADCPKLCSLQLADMAKCMADMKWTAGVDFTFLTVSIDPTETYERAKLAKLRYLGAVGRAEADRGWHFLVTPNEGNVKALADALGYKYKFDAEKNEYLHKSAMFLVNKDGVISHYLRNMAYQPADVQSKLESCARGEFGQFDEDDMGFGLNCFSYEYTDNIARAFRWMRYGGVATLVFFFSFMGYWWIRELRKPGDSKAEAT
jgi:protein SCO1/2